MIKLTAKQRTAIINALPESFFENYRNASKSEKMEMVNTLTEFLEHASDRSDCRKFFIDSLGIDIGGINI